MVGWRSPQALSSPERTSVVVIGAGPSGLAVASCLKRAHVPFLLVDEADRVGTRWHHHYDRLHLHTVRELSSLPGMPMPSEWPTYVPRQRFAEYLGSYAERFGLGPRLGVRVSSIQRRHASGPYGAAEWHVETSAGALAGRAVVVATGYNRTPVVPTFEGQATFRGEIKHSRSYSNGKAYLGKRVLVVGAGNSGAEIALDLWERGARVALCIRGPIHVTPRDVLGRPAQRSALLMARLPPKIADRLSLALLSVAVGDLSRFGIVRPAVGPVSQVVLHKKIPLIDVGTVDLIKQGQIQVVPGIDRFDEAGAVFADGRRLDLDAVVLATGYSAALEELFDIPEKVTDERGHPRWQGVEAPLGGLYFVGYRNPLTGALHDIAREGASVAEQIARSEKVAVSRRGAQPWA